MLHRTRVIIVIYNIINTDFMGYYVDRKTANLHHLIIPTRNFGSKAVRNCVVLNGESSHPYIHIVEYKDYDIFYHITKLMMLENQLGRIDPQCLKKIDDALKVFEREHSGDTNILGEPIIKEEYTKRLIIGK